MLLWTAWSAWVTAFMSFVRQCRRGMDPTSKKKEGLAGQTTYRVASQPKIIDNDELGIRVLAEVRPFSWEVLHVIFTGDIETFSHPSHASRFTRVWR